MKPKSIRAIWILISAAFCFAGTAAAFASEAPATQPSPTTQPISPEIAALIKQLGDDDFHVRQGATTKLEAMGKAAVPALQEARKSSDPEVHTRAEALLANLDHLPAGPLPQPTGFGSRSMSSSVANGKRILDLEEPGRKTHIEENSGGITMKVDGQIDGKPVSREYKAKNADELKKYAPDAYALYQQFNNNGDTVFIQGQGGVVIMRGNVNLNGRVIRQMLVQPNVVAPQAPKAVGNGDNINQLEAQIQKQMEEAKTPDAQREEVNGLLKKLREAPAPADANDADAPMREYNQRCDALRQKLADLKLPDPGDALPPPASGRLGISAEEETVAGSGLIVTHIMADSRAAKLGLKEQDVIQKVNNEPVHSTHDLRNTVTKHSKGLVIEGMRDGKELKLEEKP